MQDSIDPHVFQALIEHVFMPPQLPQNADDDDQNRAVDILMTKLIAEYADKYSSQASRELKPVLRRIQKMLRLSHRVSRDGLESGAVQQAFSSMEVGGTYWALFDLGTL